MSNLSTSTSVNSPIQYIPTRESMQPDVYAAPTMKEEYLPFTVRPVSCEDDLRKAIQLRHLAYSRHMPLFAESLKVPESDDVDDDVVVLMAESKLDGAVLGTVRIQTNRYNQLNLEQSVALPSWLKGHSIAEVRRLAVAPGSPGRLVKMVLLKACLEYSIKNDLDWIVVAARSPLDRTYEQLTFRDLLGGETFIPLPRENNVSHRVLGIETELVSSQLKAANHPLLNFFCFTNHRDIKLDGRTYTSPIMAKHQPVVDDNYLGRLTTTMLAG